MSHSIQAEKMSPIELVNPSTYNVEGCIHAEIFVDKVEAQLFNNSIKAINKAFI